MRKGKESEDREKKTRGRFEGNRRSGKGREKRDDVREYTREVGRRVEE